MVSSVRFIIKQSVSASGGTGYELEVHNELGDSKEQLLELGRQAIEVARELMKEKLR